MREISLVLCNHMDSHLASSCFFQSQPDGMMFSLHFRLEVVPLDPAPTVSEAELMMVALPVLVALGAAYSWCLTGRCVSNPRSRNSPRRKLIG